MADSFLRQVPLFGGLDDAELQALEELTGRRRYDRGALIILAEQEGDDFFIIRSGRVKVSLARDDGREIILALLGAGGVFGELSLLDGQPRSANVTAVEATELMTLQRGHLQRLLERHPHIAAAMLSELAGRLRRSDHQIGDLALSNVTNRVAKTVLRLATETGVERDEGMVLEQRPTHEQLARMAGTTRETVTRVLGRLEREGYIATRGRAIVVLRDTMDDEA